MMVDVGKLEVSSNAFKYNGMIPKKYTCDGENINPPLRIESFPDGTISLAIIVEDPDAPSGTFDHWVVWNIKPLKDIPENFKEGKSGNNSAKRKGYMGPCPPSGEHRYFFKLYALDNMLDIQDGKEKKILLHAMHNHILAAGELMGRFKR